MIKTFFWISKVWNLESLCEDYIFWKGFWKRIDLEKRSVYVFFFKGNLKIHDFYKKIKIKKIVLKTILQKYQFWKKENLGGNIDFFLLKKNVSWVFILKKKGLDFKNPMIFILTMKISERVFISRKKNFFFFSKNPMI